MKDGEKQYIKKKEKICSTRISATRYYNNNKAKFTLLIVEIQEKWGEGGDFTNQIRLATQKLRKADRLTEIK